jgi:hypothetical protein
MRIRSNTSLGAFLSLVESISVPHQKIANTLHSHRTLIPRIPACSRYPTTINRRGRCTPRRSGRALRRHPHHRQVSQLLIARSNRYLLLHMYPISMTLALVRAPLQLPDAILNPSVDARCKGAAKATHVDEEFEEGDVEDADEAGKGDDKGEAEDVAVSNVSLVV